MNDGLEFFLNGNLKAATRSSGTEWVLFNLSTYDDNCSCYLQRFDRADPFILFHSDVKVNDTIQIKIKAIDELIESPSSYETFMDLTLLERYNYLHNRLNEDKRTDSKAGIHCSINNKKAVEIPFIGHRRIGFSINQNKGITRIGLSADYLPTNSKFTSKIWHQSNLNAGDEIVVKLVETVTTESQHLYETEYLLDPSTNFQKLTKEYQESYIELTSKGLLP